MPLLSARHLDVRYHQPGAAPMWAVRDVDIDLQEGELVGLVGESGCGKSTLGYCLTRLLRPPARQYGGSIVFDGEEITSLDRAALRTKRAGGFAVVPQSGMSSLNPVRSVAGHFRDVLHAHRRMSRAEMARRSEELLAAVHLDADVLARYPHELSGGMRQRVAIAIVLALEPRLVVFDEPTTALDVLVQRAVMDTIAELQAKAGFTALVISHDLGVLLEATDRIVVMYAGRIVEERPADDLAEGALHPYTQALMRCYSDPTAEVVELTGIPGSPPDLSADDPGCSFAPRCPAAQEVCRRIRPELRTVPGGKVACHLALSDAPGGPVIPIGATDRTARGQRHAG